MSARPQPTSAASSALSTNITSPVLISPTADPQTKPLFFSEQRKASHSAPHALAARSCITCRKRKVKCDKKEPCSNCTRAGGECIFPAPGRAPRRPRVGGKTTSDREAELLKRLRRLEGVVEELSGHVEAEGVKQSPGSDSSLRRHESGTTSSTGTATETPKLKVRDANDGTGTTKEWIDKLIRTGHGPPMNLQETETAGGGTGRLVFNEGKSRYVSHPFWSQVSEEVEEIRALLYDQSLESEEDSPTPSDEIETTGSHQGFIMGYSSTDVNLRGLHPLPSQIPFYWQTFLDNVHPLVMIVHSPTMSKTIKAVQSDMESLSKSTEALMFSIYFATITSMTAEEVNTNFGISKTVLLRQYRFATEQALARANLLKTNDIVTIQALVLFLICVRRHDDTRFVWTMTGLAIRIAQSLGLHRDGAKFGLSPFDTEMRRRLWWQVCILDVRASEDHGSDPSVMTSSYDTELPTSCNDLDLDPSQKEPVKPREGVSEMTFCLIRFEICSLARVLTYSPPGGCPAGPMPPPLTLEEKEEMIKEKTTHLEKTYLKYCENAGPLYWVAATVARLIAAKMALILYHPLIEPDKTDSLTSDTRDRLFMASIEILEYSQLLEAEASTKKWGWLFATYIQWHAIAYLLGELAIRDNSIIVKRAWQAVDNCFGACGVDIFKGKHGTLWRPLRKLALQARKRRGENNAAAALNGIHLELGISKENLRPTPSGYPSKLVTPFAQPGMTMRDPTQVDPHAHETQFLTNIPLYQPGTQMMNGMEMASDQGLIDPQMYQQLDPNGVSHQFGPNQSSWILDNATLQDMDMDGVEADVDWRSWDDLVRGFQFDQGAEMMDTTRGPVLGGMGNWW